MLKLKNTLRSFLVEDDAATMVEYGLLIALIAIVVAAAALLLGTAISTKFNSVTSCVTNSTGC